MKTLVFDTETSGFYDPKRSFDDPLQGRVVQLAACLLDNEFNIVNSFYAIIKPEGFSNIGSGALATHGISIEKCHEFGLPRRQALNMFNSLYEMADVKVAHNLQFDAKMLTTECSLEYGKCDYDWEDTSTHFCTMRALTPIIMLPGNGKFGQQYKWPKLQEAYYYCYSKNFDDAHDAMNDVRATAEVFEWLVKNKHFVAPKVLAC